MCIYTPAAEVEAGELRALDGEAEEPAQVRHMERLGDAWTQQY